MKKIRIILADDHPGYRSGIKAYLSEEEQLQVIAEAGNGRELLDQLKKALPDIVLLDISMPVMDGYEALTVIKRRYPEVKVILLSQYYNKKSVPFYVKTGALSFLDKGIDQEELIKAIRVVHNGKYYFSDTTAELIEFIIHKNVGKQDELTDKEILVVRMLCKGKSNKEIAQELSISANTVAFHRNNIYKKAQAKNTVGLVFYAIQKGIILVPDNRIPFGKSQKINNLRNKKSADPEEFASI
jgi:DNA-binding NarL/FixJ family response regulator